MPTGSLVPHLSIERGLMPTSINFTWWILRIALTFYSGRTYISIDTLRKMFLDTFITIHHGRNELWHPDKGNITETMWGIQVASQHWVMLAATLNERGFKWARTEILDTNIIECGDADVKGTIFGISNVALFN